MVIQDKHTTQFITGLGDLLVAAQVKARAFDSALQRRALEQAAEEERAVPVERKRIVLAERIWAQPSTLCKASLKCCVMPERF